MQHNFIAQRNSSDSFCNVSGIVFRQVLLLAMLLSFSPGKTAMSFAPSLCTSILMHQTRGGVGRFFLPTTSLSVLSSPPAAVPQNRSLHNNGYEKNKNANACIHRRDEKSKRGLVLQPLVVCGPSGVGKGTIIQKYMEEYGGSKLFGFTVSHTTRQPRPGEMDGVHYHFTDVPTIKEAIKRYEFLEFAQVHGNWYGTSLKSLKHVQETEAKLPLLDIDVQGVKNIKEWQKKQQANRAKTSDDSNNIGDSIPFLDAKFIFIAPPSLETLKDRLMSRGTESVESLERRTANAVAEVEYGMQDGNFDEIVVNDDLIDACVKFKHAIEKIYGDKVAE